MVDANDMAIIIRMRLCAEWILWRAVSFERVEAKRKTPSAENEPYKLRNHFIKAIKHIKQTN